MKWSKGLIQAAGIRREPVGEQPRLKTAGIRWWFRLRPNLRVSAPSWILFSAGRQWQGGPNHSLSKGGAAEEWWMMNEYWAMNSDVQISCRVDAFICIEILAQRPKLLQENTLLLFHLWLIHNISLFYFFFFVFNKRWSFSSLICVCSLKVNINISAVGGFHAF